MERHAGGEKHLENHFFKFWVQLFISLSVTLLLNWPCLQFEVHQSRNILHRNKAMHDKIIVGFLFCIQHCTSKRGVHSSTAMHDVQNLFMLMPEFLRFTPLYILSGSCFLYREEIAAPLPTLKIENMFPQLLRRGGGQYIHVLQIVLCPKRYF